VAVVFETIFERPSLDISDSLLKSLIYIHVSVDKVLVLFTNTTSLLTLSNENLIDSSTTTGSSSLPPI
jgi:hypothetical protein